MDETSEHLALTLDDGTRWCSSVEAGELGWICRYAHPPETVLEVRHLIASVLSNYIYLVSAAPTTEDAMRKLRLLRRADREHREKVREEMIDNV